MKYLHSLCIVLLIAQAGFTQKKPIYSYGQQFATIGSLSLESGEVIKDCSIGYRVHGKLNSTRSNAIAYLTWFGGNSSGVESTKPWKCVDTTRFCLIIIDALGNGVSSSPSNSVAQPGTQFPKFAIADMVNSQYKLLTEKFKIRHLVAVMGVSMGGMQTFQWAVSYPSFMDKLIPIVGSPKPSAYDMLLYRTFLEVLDTDTAFNKGNYVRNPRIGALNLFWDLFLTTPGEKIRAAENVNLDEWIDAQKRADHPDWNDTRAQIQAIIHHNIAEKFSSMADAAAHVKAKMLIAVSSQDHMVNPTPAINFSKLLSSKLLTIDNEYGHLAPGGNQQLEDGIKEILR